VKRLTIEKLPDEYYEKYGLVPPTNLTSTYLIPTVHEALKYAKIGWEKVYDPIERKMIEGPPAVLWTKVDG
jgi:hypothetical protein